MGSHHNSFNNPTTSDHVGVKKFNEQDCISQNEIPQFSNIESFSNICEADNHLQSHLTSLNYDFTPNHNVHYKHSTSVGKKRGDYSNKKEYCIAYCQ
jgi:hypothetical protein